ncbi:hypothetical protein QBC34DRAFT_2345 [Podospora aff. communis PSN243]|uniref:GDP/GTP exchange factor Sec2 N-terminal domain-containing protein n=1 Tax=Podospora aff. communis PSN243 TaxID=3040156 RepID=A0AAV9H542_9PEZI|nr:hypothetical protein QBC34DRAFT_2345 [Podospora aff. communis PSN243]
MLSNSPNNPAFSSPQPEQRPPHARSPLPARAPARGSSNQITVPDGYASPRHAEKRVAPSQQQQHGFNTPRPSLSPLSEYHSGFSNEDLGSPFTPTHRRQQSFPNLLPASFRSRTPSPIRKPQPPTVPEAMPLTGDNRSTARLDSPKTGFAGWFSGAAASTPDATPTKLRRNTTNASSGDPATPKNAASRFMSVLSSRFTATPTSPIVDDELTNLNIEAALFPPGSPTDRDPFSPAAFKNLQMNALGLLTKFQAAYRDRVAALQELQGEKLAQREELEEAETRARHLKMQLEGMAKKAQEQEREMRQLMDELAAERKARLEDRLAAEKFFSEGSMVSEDLGVDDDRRRRKWVRKSADTVKSEGFETDEESAESESVFSRCRSPTIPSGAGMDGNTIDSSATPVQSRTSSLLPPPRTRATQQQQPPQPMSAFQKIIKGIAGDSEDAGVAECKNCKGQDASVAWDTVSLLRDENKHLKQRVGQLELAVEGALDLVNGIGL